MMKKEMEEEIRSQLLANQEMLAGAEGTGMSWEEKVILQPCSCFILFIPLLKVQSLFCHRNITLYSIYYIYSNLNHLYVF